MIERAALATFACLFALSPASSTPASEPITVTLWHQMRPGDRAILMERLKEYKDPTGADVRVRALYKETEELRSGMESAVLVGRGPDIIYHPADTVGVYDEIGALRDLSEFFDSERRSGFDPDALVTAPPEPGNDKERLLLVGDRFGNHLALVYNRNLVPEPPETNEDLVRIAKDVTKDEDGDGKPEQYGLVWNYTEPFFVVPFLTGYGGWVFDERMASEGRFVPTLDTPEARAAYDFVSKLRNVHRVLPKSADYETASALFVSGKAAMIINGDWSWDTYLAVEEIDAAVAPLPIVKETGLPMAPMVAPKGYSLSVAASTDEQIGAAGRLIQYLTDEATQRRYLKAMILPSRLALRDEFNQALGEEQSLIMAASIEQVRRGRPMPTAVEIRAVWDGMRPAYQQLMAGTMTPDEAPPAMQALTESNIAALTETIEPDSTVWLIWLGGVASLAAFGWALLRWWSVFRVDYARNRLAYLLAAPAMLLIFGTVVFPLAYNVVLSFSNMSLQNFHDWRIVGLSNYADAFVGRDSTKFWGVFFKTIVWTVVNVSLHVAIGVFLAVVLNGPVRGKSIYRVLLIIPWAVPAYITALTWRGMFDTEFGAVNQLVSAINAWLPSWLHLPLVNWLNEAGPAFTACIIANVWLGFPFMMVITLGGLQGIPQDLYEAARIDRATRWQQFWNITVPMLKPVLLPAIVLGSVWTFNNLNVVWLVSNRGEPADQTHILVSYVYRAVFNLYQYGYGAALSMVIFAMLLAFSAVFLRQTKAAEGV